MKRTFIYTDEKSNKFWSIETNGNEFTVTYGKVGTAGQVQTKSFADEAACEKEANKLIGEKTKKGYIEQGDIPASTTKAEPKSKAVAKPKASESLEINISSEPTFREATDADLPALVAIMQRVVKTNPIFREDIQKKLEGRGIAKYISAANTTVMLINGVIVGSALHGQYIMNLVIDVPYQHKGLGTKLFNHVYKLVENTVKKEGSYDYIMVMFYTEDQLSKSFYAKLGFVKRSETNQPLFKMYLQMYTKDLPKEKRTVQKPTHIEEQNKIDAELLKICKAPKLAHNYQLATDVIALLEKGANPNVQYDDGSTPLYRLLKDDNLHYVETLIGDYLLYSPDLSIKDNNSLSAMHYLATQQQPFIINKYAKKLVENGANPKAVDNNGCTALFYFNTSYGGNAGEAVEALVSAGVDPAAKNNKGQNALAYRASCQGDMSVLSGLMREVPVIDIDNENNTVLHAGALAEDSFSSSYFIDRALKCGVDINAKNNKGQTALHLAKENYLEELILQNPDFNAQDNEGNTPLHTHNDKKWDIAHLLTTNPDVTIKNKAGVSAADYIRGLKNISNRSLELLEKLEKEGVKTAKKSDTKTGLVAQQVNLNAKSVFTNPIITGSIVLEQNDGGTGVSYLGGNMIQVVADHWGEVTDVIDVTSSSVWRIPPPPDRRIGSCIMDENYYYAVSIKGYEAIFQNLIKIDKATQQEVWTCGLSSYQGKLNFFQDNEHIYYTDQKSFFTISKAKGKVLAKHPIIGLGIYLKDNKNRLIACEPTDKKNTECKLVMAEPVSGEKLWTTSLGAGEQIILHTIDNGKLYILGAKNIIYCINLETGEILKKFVADIDSKNIYKESQFQKSTDILNAVVRSKNDDRYLITIDVKKDACSVTSFTNNIPTSKYSPTEIVKDGYIYAVDDEGVFIIDSKTKEQIAFIEPINYGGSYDVINAIVLGDTLYMLQKGGLTYKDSSVLHQIKNA